MRVPSNADHATDRLPESLGEPQRVTTAAVDEQMRHEAEHNTEKQRE